MEKNNFNHILAIKISVAFEFNSTNSSKADTNLDTFRFYQKGLKETDNQNIWVTVVKIRKGTKSLKEKGINYAERRSMLQKSLKL